MFVPLGAMYKVVYVLKKKGRRRKKRKNNKYEGKREKEKEIPKIIIITINSLLFLVVQSIEKMND
jgi:hypothetical protein